MKYALAALPEEKLEVKSCVCLPSGSCFIWSRTICLPQLYHLFEESGVLLAEQLVTLSKIPQPCCGIWGLVPPLQAGMQNTWLATTCTLHLNNLDEEAHA